MSRKLWGIVGGLGPLASAEFLKTIYEESAPEQEQSGPAVMLLSDPSFPDRTEYLRAGRTEELAAKLNASIHVLLRLGVTDIAVCCVTLHAVLGSVPPAARRRMVSLVDLIVDAVHQSSCRHIMICTLGTRMAGIFDKHPQWHSVAEQVAMLREEEQTAVHGMLYEIKRNVICNRHIELVANLMSKYRTESFVAGCTELHILQRKLRASGTGLRSIDPLQILAERIARSQTVQAVEVCP